MASRLDPTQIAHFRDEGYLLYRAPVFNPERFDELKARFEQTLQEQTIAKGLRPEAMDMPHYDDPKLLDWLLADEVLDLVEPLVGPDIALLASHFICKPAGDGRRVPWHEDSSYWGTLVQPMEVVTLWLAIDAADDTNGCMRVMPRTHHNGYSRYHALDEIAVFDREIDAEAIDESEAVSCVLDPNECSFHHAKMIHGSNANTSDRRRCGYTIRYMPTTSKLDVSDYHRKDFKIFLARGRDRAGNRYTDPSRMIAG